jgi:hypothetical protein
MYIDIMTDYQHIAGVIAQQHGIAMCYRCNCRTGSYDLGHSRAHAHKEGRKICLSALPKTFKSFFTVLHEIGHIVHPKGHSGYGQSGTRAEGEHYATEWAKDVCRKLHIPLKRKVIASYNRYITNKVERGLRRGLRAVPAEVRKYLKK